MHTFRYARGRSKSLLQGSAAVSVVKIRAAQRRKTSEISPRLSQESLVILSCVERAAGNFQQLHGISSCVISTGKIVSQETVMEVDTTSLLQSSSHICDDPLTAFWWIVMQKAKE